MPAPPPPLLPISSPLTPLVPDLSPATTNSNQALFSTTSPCHSRTTLYCVLNPAVTQSTLRKTICLSGWTATVRPSSYYTTKLKKASLLQYAYQHKGDKNWTLSGTEEDHRLPLELGGSPSDPHNLSPEEYVGLMGSTAKDKDENSFKASVCSGKRTLAQAQSAFVAKWLASYPAFRDGKPSG